MPLSGKTVLGMAAATGELQLYTLSDRQVRNLVQGKSSQIVLLWLNADSPSTIITLNMPFPAPWRTL